MYISRSSWRLNLKTRLRPSTNPRQRLFPPQWLQTCLVSPMFFPPLGLLYVSTGTGGFCSLCSISERSPDRGLFDFRLVEGPPHFDADDAVQEEADQVAGPPEHEEVEPQQR